MKNIAIMGSSGGAGKDTVADMISDIAGIDYHKISLAQEIHKICNKLSENPQRRELQAVGESMRDIFGESVWMNLTDKSMQGPTIVPDIRKLLEYSHYVVERDFLPLYVYTDPEVARNRLKERDGSFDERDLKKNIETQMDFIQELPATRVGNYSLYKVNDSGIFNNIYIIDNSRSIKETREQVEKWWDLVG
ncbi:dephospho-CoA kinase [Limosilactobacillus reuteri]|uniref:dephospho-CoA kinase n=1 Tax=Limosilactobacillus reuteri TaxID=1598 RepID=UPI000A321A28|nr:hypothetical protein [Limosilactobacillus reuteri]